MSALPSLATSTALSPTDLFLDVPRFNQLYRVATAFANSLFVPAAYRGKPESCMIAFDLAQRLDVHPVMLMQNTFEVGGRPGFTVEFLVALASFRGVFTGPIQYRETGTAKGGDLAVTAYATLAKGGIEVDATVTLAEAKADGWTRNAKYQSIPEQMLRKRAAGRLIGLYAPEIKFGFPTLEEAEDRIRDLGVAEVLTTAPQAAPAAPSRPAAEPQTTISDPRQVYLEEVAAQAAPAAPQPAPEADRFAVLDRFGEVVSTYAKAGVPAQKALQAEIDKCQSVAEIEALLEHNAALVAAMAPGCVGNVRDTAEARRAELKPLEPAPARQVAGEVVESRTLDDVPTGLVVRDPAPEPELPLGSPAPAAEPARAAIDDSLRVPVPTKADGSTDYAALFARLKKAIAAAPNADHLDAWRDANLETLESLAKNVPTWARALSDALAARQSELGG
jgi:hypothetical protein